MIELCTNWNKYVQDFQVFILKLFLCYRQTQGMYHEVYQSRELWKSTSGQRYI
jgi:hypothetical protein